MEGKQFLGKSPVDSADIRGVKNFDEIALFRTVSEINAFLRFTQKFKMAAKYGGENDLWEKSTVDSTDTLGVKNFDEIALSCIVSEMNVFLHFTQKVKMAAKNGGKTIFGKSRQSTLKIP